MKNLDKGVGSGNHGIKYNEEDRDKVQELTYNIPQISGPKKLLIRDSEDNLLNKGEKKDTIVYNDYVQNEIPSENVKEKEKNGNREIESDSSDRERDNTYLIDNNIKGLEAKNPPPIFKNKDNKGQSTDTKSGSIDRNESHHLSDAHKKKNRISEMN